MTFMGNLTGSLKEKKRTVAKKRGESAAKAEKTAETYTKADLKKGCSSKPKKAERPKKFVGRKKERTTKRGVGPKIPDKKGSTVVAA